MWWGPGPGCDITTIMFSFSNIFFSLMRILNQLSYITNGVYRYKKIYIYKGSVYILPQDFTKLESSYVRQYQFNHILYHHRKI